MSRIPKFIRTDKLRLKTETAEKVMFIEKFKTVLQVESYKRVYTGLIHCYWYEGTYFRKDVFREDELERVAY